VQGAVKKFNGSLTHGDPKCLVYEFTLEPLPPTPNRFWGIVLMQALWTALLSLGLAFALVIGQNRYLRRKWLLPRQGVLLFIGATAVGVIAGGIGQVLFGTIGRWEAIAQVARVAGWTLLGALLGWGMGYFIPNLSTKRAAWAGAAGGLVGAVAFLYSSQLGSDALGRLLGATILGSCIGAMIALAEAVFREAWLEIHYGPRESRTVSLGRQPVTIGSNPELCTVLARGAPAVALRYTLCDGRITCEDVAAYKTLDVTPGDRRTVGNLDVVVCAATSSQGQIKQFTAVDAGPGVGAQQRDVQGPSAPVTQPGGKGGFQLCIRGRRIALGMGVRLTASEIAGLETTAADHAVAEVVPNPTDASIIGLKNLSTRAWTATLPSGERKDIEPGRSGRLAVGTKFHFGVLEGVVEQAP
jgi:hypothetical protein